MIGHSLWIVIPAFLALTMLAGYFYQRIGEARDSRYPPIGELIDIGARKLHMIRKGTGGPTVVIENGAGGSSFLWWGYQDKLAESTTVITYDRAGLGWSDPAPLSRTMEERAADLRALLVKANVPPPYILVGYSYGGFLIRLFARDHRSEVAGLVFIDAGHEAVYSRPEVLASYNKKLSAVFRMLGRFTQFGVLRLFRIRLKKPPAELLTDDQRKILAEGLYPARAFFVGADEILLAGTSGEAMAGMNTPGSLGDVPIAVVTHGLPFPGAASVLETHWRTGQDQLAALSTNSTLIVAEKSYHDVLITEPEVVMSAIKKVVVAARANMNIASAR